LLNETCFCIGLDRDALASEFDRVAGLDGFSRRYITPTPHLFADVPLFLGRADIARMTDAVRVIEKVQTLEPYRKTVLEWAPANGRLERGVAGVFAGYDFHLGRDGPRLIEINTNAGGAALNAVLTRALLPCCPQVSPLLQLSMVRDFDVAIVEMFRAEWRRAGRTGDLRSIAIVDDQPASQFLYPEFLLIKAVLARAGIAAEIVDGGSLEFFDGRLHADGAAFDLVYNRLVDFALSRPEHAALSHAYQSDAVVVTPGPRQHALAADKRNLCVLSDPDHPVRQQLTEAERAVLDCVPRTELVTTCAAERLWEHRKHYFFKPAGGHGSKAVYRGDKLTRRVWGDILAGSYIAQSLVPPDSRHVRVKGAETTLKADVRLYTYAGEVLLAAARLYDGQTTNLRTPGGGFAPVLVV
jgi:hypothetical protein